MKKIGVVLIGLILLNLACSTDVAPTVTEAEQLAIDIEKIDAWLAENNISNVLIHPTGIRYTINEAGTGPKVGITDIVRITYEGRFLDSGEIFDSGQVGPAVFNASWPYIEGWYHMVLEMSEGDNFTAYIPSKYGYGVNGSGPIGSNTVLVFDMNLDKVGN